MLQNNSLADMIILSEKDQLPNIILGVSPCRSGSTILLRVFGANQVLSIFQPFKNLLRWNQIGKPKQFSLKNVFAKNKITNKDIVFIKETLGPYHNYECFFNPLAMLLEAGYPADKITVLLNLRDPITTWSSWKEIWGTKTSLARMLSTFQAMSQINEYAISHNIKCVFYTYELLNKLPTKQLMSKLFNQLKITQKTDIIIDNFDQLPEFGTPGSNIIWPKEPNGVAVDNVHLPVKESKQYHFKSRLPINLSSSEVAQINSSNIQQIYQKFWKISQEMLT
ncbi:MAG: hypothetical protein WCJ58_02885 [bacterium]